MDFITHSLVGAGVARLACPRKSWLPQLTLAGLLGSLLMDGDSWLFFVGPDAYGRYHRVLTHNVFALTLLAFLSATITTTASCVPNWRRFGWFLAPNLASATPLPERAPWGRFLVIAAIAAALHWCYDFITGYGNLRPLWPFSQHEIALCAVFSFDWVIFSLTLGWHLLIRELDWPRRKETWISAGYFIMIVVYVAARRHWGQPTSW